MAKIVALVYILFFFMEKSLAQNEPSTSLSVSESITPSASGSVSESVSESSSTAPSTFPTFNMTYSEDFTIVPTSKKMSGKKVSKKGTSSPTVPKVSKKNKGPKTSNIFS